MSEASSTSVVKPEAVLWDLDGTIIDSEEYWIIAEEELVLLFGGTWTHQDGMDLVGNGLAHTAAALQAKGVQLSIDEIIQTLTSRVLEQLEVAIPWRPGAIDLIESCNQAGIKQALVTMSIKRMATTVASAIPGNPFQAVIAGDMVSQPKPDPEPYLVALEALGVSPQQAVAMEDSPAGCTSALRAGVVTVGIENLVSLETVDTHVLLTTLAGVTVEDLCALYTQNAEVSA